MVDFKIKNIDKTKDNYIDKKQMVIRISVQNFMVNKKLHYHHAVKLNQRLNKLFDNKRIETFIYPISIKIRLKPIMLYHLRT